MNHFAAETNQFLSSEIQRKKKCKNLFFSEIKNKKKRR